MSSGVFAVQVELAGRWWGERQLQEDVAMRLRRVALVLVETAIVTRTKRKYTKSRKAGRPPASDANSLADRRCWSLSSRMMDGTALSAWLEPLLDSHHTLRYQERVLVIRQTLQRHTPMKASQLNNYEPGLVKRLISSCKKTLGLVCIALAIDELGERIRQWLRKRFFSLVEQTM